MKKALLIILMCAGCLQHANAQLIDEGASKHAIAWDFGGNYAIGFGFRLDARAGRFRFGIPVQGCTS